MIVAQTQGGLRLITQPAHAALSGRIMTRWQPLQDAERRASILVAIEEHDNGWRVLDDEPSVDPTTGRIYDFINAPAASRQGVWPRGIANLAHDPWAAALVAQHALTVYDRYRKDAAWDRFFAGIEQTRNELLARTPLTLEQLVEDYAFVRIGDLISLIFCTGWDEESFGAWTFRRTGDRVSVSPSPFGGAELPIAIVAREIPDRAYASDSDLRATLRAAPPVTLQGVVG